MTVKIIATYDFLFVCKKSQPICASLSEVCNIKRLQIAEMTF